MCPRTQHTLRLCNRSLSVEVFYTCEIPAHDSLQQHTAIVSPAGATCATHNFKGKSSSDCAKRRKEMPAYRNKKDESPSTRQRLPAWPAGTLLSLVLHFYTSRRKTGKDGIPIRSLASFFSYSSRILIGPPRPRFAVFTCHPSLGYLLALTSLSNYQG